MSDTQTQTPDSGGECVSDELSAYELGKRDGFKAAIEAVNVYIARDNACAIRSGGAGTFTQGTEDSQ